MGVTSHRVFCIMANEQDTPSTPSGNNVDDFETAEAEVFGGPEAEPLTPADINPTVEGWPEPTHNAKEQAPADQPAPNGAQPNAPQSGELKDRKGRVFNPQIHSSNPDGTPKFNKNGLFIFKGAGRPKGSAANEAEDYGADNYDAQAEQMLRLYYGGMQTVFDDDAWQPTDEAEHTFVKNPLARVFREMQMPQLPAKLEFGLAFSAYNIKRTQSPKTKEKLIILWLRVRAWFGKKKPEPLPPEDDGKKKPDDSTPPPS